MDLFLVYLICFGVGLLFAILSFVFADFGGHGDGQAASGHMGSQGHAEGGFNHGDMPGFSVLSPTSLATFITSFGGLGMIFCKLEWSRSPWISAPLATVGAMVIAGTVVMMFRSVFAHTQSSSESRVDGLVGKEGNVLTPIPEQGVGEIAYIDGGVRYTAPARSESGGAIGGGANVTITRVVGSQFFVKVA